MTAPTTTASATQPRTHRERYTAKFLERATQYFAAHHTVNPVTGCWIWTEPPRPNGRIEIEIRPNFWVAAYRFAWQQHKGPLGKDDVLYSTCHNSLCVNPDHRRVGPKPAGLDHAGSRRDATIEDLVATLTTRL